MAPRWSILLPTHDRAEVVGFAISSVLAQSEEDWELLVVGDGCTDDTASVVASFEDDRIRWFDLPKAPGFGYANRNVALREARGALIGFIAHDDLLLPDHLESMGPLFDRDEVEWAYSRPLWIEDDGTIVPFAVDLRRPDAYEDFMHVANRIPASCVVHRRECLERYSWWPEEIMSSGDYWLWKQMIGPSNGVNLDYLPAPTCLHFRADWRTEPTFGPPPLSAWLGEAHGGWWPQALSVDVSGVGLVQEALSQQLRRDGSSWSARCREAVVSAIDGFAWNAAVQLPELEGWLVERARAFIDDDDPASALDLIDHGLKLAPTSAQLLTARASALLPDGDATAAEAAARKALELAPSRVAPHDWLVRALVAQDRPDEAMAAARAGLAIRPEATSLRVQLGVLLLRAGDVAGAEECAREAARRDPDAPGPTQLLRQIESERA